MRNDIIFFQFSFFFSLSTAIVNVMRACVGLSPQNHMLLEQRIPSCMVGEQNVGGASSAEIRVGGVGDAVVNVKSTTSTSIPAADML